MNNMNFWNYASTSAGDENNFKQSLGARSKGGRNIHEFSEIESLDDSDLLTHRRSKSTSYKERQSVRNKHNLFNSNTSNNRILLKKVEDTEGEFTIKDDICLDMSSNKQEYKYDSLRQEIEVPPTEESYVFTNTKDRLYAKYSDEIRDDTTSCLNTNKNNFGKNKHISPNFERDSLIKMNNKSIINARLSLHDEMMFWKDNFHNLKQKYEESRDNYKSWRSNYFRLLEDSLVYEETVKNLLEENRIHQEYIISLENKINRIISSCTTLTENFHRSLAALNNSRESSNSNKDNSNSVYNQILSDYKKQLEILAEEKESLSTSLSLSRHQQLQVTMKLEVMQNRLLLIERARLDNFSEMNN